MYFLKFFNILIDLKVEGIDLIVRKMKEVFVEFNIFEY